MRLKTTVVMTLILLSIAGYAFAQQIDANALLKEADDQANAMKDMSMTMTMEVFDPSGKSSGLRELKILQKGERRLIRFYKPVKDRGMAFLSLPGDVSFVYLPEFQKTRRIASHKRNQTFMGTDFTSEDMSTLRYSDAYDAKLAREEGNFYVLELTQKPGAKKGYSKLEIYIDKTNKTQNTIIYFNENGEKFKTETRSEYVRHGDYWSAGKVIMANIKENHKTVCHMSDFKFDQGLPDDLFSQRTLKRPFK